MNDRYTWNGKPVQELTGNDLREWVRHRPQLFTHSRVVDRTSLSMVDAAVLDSEPGAQDESLFDSCVRDIASTYKALGHRLGWRFLCVPRAILDAPVHIALITTNPGGSEIPADHPWESCEAGVSYLGEAWNGSKPGKDNLQLQVQGLFRTITQVTSFAGPYEALMAQSLIAYFIPFRSRRLASLHRKAESIAFGIKLWRRILPVAKPRLVICIDRAAYKEFLKIIPNALSAQPGVTKKLETGWGSHYAEVAEFRRARDVIRLLRLPHLGSFRLFSRRECAEPVRRILTAACMGR